MEERRAEFLSVMPEDEFDDIIASLRTTMTSTIGVTLMTVITTLSTSADRVPLPMKMSVAWGGNKVKSGKKSDEGR